MKLNLLLGRRDVMVGLGLVSLGGAIVPVVTAGCRRDAADPPDRGQILSDLSSLIMAPSYVDAATDAKSLETALAALRDGPTAESLAAARTAWKKARTSWKATDAFLIGPADDLAVTGGIIDEIPDATKIEANVAGTTVLDDAAVQKLGANQRGLGGVEALLFDPSKDDAAMLAAFQAADARRRTLAALVGTDLRIKVEKVRDAWSSDYAGQIGRAGRGSTVYTSEKQGVDAIINALIAAAEVVIALRLAKPLGLDKTPATPQPELIESPRSDSSIDDILAVLDGIESVYMTKSRDGQKSGLALSAAVAERSPAADTRMKTELVKAKDAVRAIPGPLRTAILERRDPVILAHAACREVKRALATDVAAALGTSVGFNVTDGD